MTAPTDERVESTDERTGFRRGAAVVVVASLVLLGLALDEGLGGGGPSGSFVATTGQRGERVSTVPGPDTLSAAWHCAEGTSERGGRAAETVIVANAGEVPVDAVITVLRGAEHPVRHAVEVPPRARTEVPIADVVETSEPGVVVEAFGGLVAVEHRLVGAGDHEVLPCSRHASDRWWFAGGMTVRDAADHLALLNPFGDDAIVDMTFFTEDGIEQPGALQSFVVPARSRASVPVHEHVLRKEVAAAEIVARTGRIVAERSVMFDGSTARRGLAVFPGERSPAPEWIFPEGLVGEAILEDLWILNPGDSVIEVEVQAQLDGDEVIEPEFVELSARSATSLRLNEFLDEGVGHSIRVTVEGEGEVVVAQAIQAHEGAVRPGFTVVSGVTESARRWIFPAGSADDTFDQWIIVANAGMEEAEFGMSVLASGVLLVPEGFGSLDVRPTERGVFRLGDALKRSDLPIVVESDRPVAVVRGLFTESSLSISPGIPFRDP